MNSALSPGVYFQVVVLTVWAQDYLSRESRVSFDQAAVPSLDGCDNHGLTQACGVILQTIEGVSKSKKVNRP